jgi:hypothetical protein
VNELVSSNSCVACPAGTTNAADDDASGANTTCDATLCDVNELVSSNSCVACPAGTTNAADDDASGANTTCDATLCDVNQRVDTFVCEDCPPGVISKATGDLATGVDTDCNIDCVGSWSACTADCSDATYTITTAKSGQGADCVAADTDTRPCASDEGDCIVTDCAGSWSACTAACELANAPPGRPWRGRQWTETVAQSGTGQACPSATDCVHNENACVMDPNTCGIFTCSDIEISALNDEVGYQRSDCCTPITCSTITCSDIETSAADDVEIVDRVGSNCCTPITCSTITCSDIETSAADDVEIVDRVGSNCCSDATVTVTASAIAVLTLDGEFSDISVEGSQERILFERLITEDMAREAGIDASNINIVSIEGGSISVEFEIIQSDESAREGPTPTEALDIIKKKVDGSTSPTYASAPVIAFNIGPRPAKKKEYIYLLLVVFILSILVWIIYENYG